MKAINETLKQLRRGIGIATAVAALGFASTAVADPVNFLPAGADVIFKFNDLEPVLPTTVGAPVGPTIFTITTISAPSGTPIYWASGISDGMMLVGVVSGQTVQTITPNGGGFDITLTGGTINVYLVPLGSYVPTSPGASIPSQICGGPSGGVCPAPWLTLNLVPGIVPTIPGSTEFVNVNSLTVPLTGSGFANLVVTGGTATTRFPVGSIASENFNFSSCPGTGAFAILCTQAGTWPVVSFDPVTSRTVPEPATLLLLGLGVLGAAVVRRRSQR